MLALVWIVVLMSESLLVSAEKCFETPCEYENDACFTSGCERVGLQTICQLTSTNSKEPAVRPSKCVAPRDVPGFVEFCAQLLTKSPQSGPPGPVDIQDSVITSSTTTDNPTNGETIQELSPGETCFGTTILVSVGIGSLAAGSALTLIALCFLRMLCPVRSSKEEELSSQDSDSRERIRSRGLGSTSTAQLLPNATPDPGTHGTLPFTPDHNNQGSNSQYPVAVLESVYTAASESSSRDYQSIQCGSETPYILHSESDYYIGTGHRQMVSSEVIEPGTSHDYSSLKGQEFGRQDRGDYYPVSEGSNRDYTSLAGDAEEGAYHQLDTPFVRQNQLSTQGMTSSSNASNVTFRVSGMDFPNGRTSRNRVHVTREPSAETSDAAVAASTLHEEMGDEDSPHEYFILDPIV